LTRHQVTEIALSIRKAVNSKLRKGFLPDPEQRFVDHARDYCSALSPAEAKPHLYRLLSRGNEWAAEWALEVTENRRFLDRDHIRKILGSESFQAWTSRRGSTPTTIWLPLVREATLHIRSCLVYKNPHLEQRNSLAERVTPPSLVVSRTWGRGTKQVLAMGPGG
jgi:hypothetical protein